MSEKNDIKIIDIGIRHHQDEKSGEFYYSIVDVIDILGLSSDPRNYWKVLKNRLKKSCNELVTECNQLKMRAGDGKSYLTDVATSSTILQIIQIICPEKVAMFSGFFAKIEKKNLENDDPSEKENGEISTVFTDEGEIQIDMYRKDDCIFIHAMIAGIDPNDIFISASYNELTIKGTRIKNNNYKNDLCNLQELFWGKFSRVITLPSEIDIDQVQALTSHGLLTIKLPVLDKTRTKIVKTKSI